MLNGTSNIIDDIIVHGKTREEHDQNLGALLNRLQDKHLTLNKATCEFGRTRIKYYGSIFSESGFSQDPVKVEAIKNVKRQKTVGEVRIFLGMANHVSLFIKYYSLITEPLLRLTKQAVGEVRIFLGMANHVSLFIKYYSLITEPLLRLTKQENAFTWTDEQEHALISFKGELGK